MDVEEIIVIELVVELVVVEVDDITFDEVDGITRGTPEIWKEYVINVTCMWTVTVLLIIIIQW